MASGNSVLHPVHVVATENKSLLHPLGNGQLVITGKLTEQVTNLQSGESESFKAVARCGSSLTTMAAPR